MRGAIDWVGCSEHQFTPQKRGEAAVLNKAAGDGHQRATISLGNADALWRGDGSELLASAGGEAVAPELGTRVFGATVGAKTLNPQSKGNDDDLDEVLERNDPVGLDLGQVDRLPPGVVVGGLANLATATRRRGRDGPHEVSHI